MKIGIAVLGAAAMLAASPAAAQEFVHWAAPVAPVRGAVAYFPLGTPVKLVTRTQVSSKANKPGDRLYLELTGSLCYRGQVVVPAGALAVAEVADLQPNGHFGKKGKLGIRLLYVQTPGGPVRLSGRAANQGTSGTAASIATIALAPVIVSWTGIFIHGTSAQLPSGTEVAGYLAEDMRFAVQPPTLAAAVQATPDTAADRAAYALPPTGARALPASFVAGGLGAQPVRTAQR